MSESNITKRAMADSLKTLMKNKDFSKISVMEICGLCGVTRKSFYYHFKDKYDLANWIFYTNFVEQAENRKYGSIFEFLDDLSVYLFSERDFYKDVLKIEGQNSFRESFFQAVRPIVNQLIFKMFKENPEQEYYTYFFCEGILAILSSWIQCEEGIPPKEFIQESHYVVSVLAQEVIKNDNSEGDKID